LDYGVIGYATSMPGDAQSIQSDEIARGIETVAQRAAAEADLKDRTRPARPLLVLS
jgi:hypothetical protein